MWSLNAFHVCQSFRLFVKFKNIHISFFLLICLISFFFIFFLSSFLHSLIFLISFSFICLIFLIFFLLYFFCLFLFSSIHSLFCPPPHTHIQSHIHIHNHTRTYTHTHTYAIINTIFDRRTSLQSISVSYNRLYLQSKYSFRLLSYVLRIKYQKSNQI